MSTDFNYLSKSELINLCQERNIKTAKSYTKDQLIDLLNGKELTKKIKCDNKPYKCDIEGCDYSCTRKEYLEKHKNNGHDTNKNVVYNLFVEFIEEHKIEVIGEYTYKNLNNSKRIVGKCKSKECNELFEKDFKSLTKKGGPYCKKCTSKLSKEKTKQTNLEKYGCIYTFQSKEVKEKIKKTNFKKYGVEYATQSEEVKNKTKQTNLDRIGVEYPTQNKEVMKKSKQTNIEKRGVEYPTQSQEVREKVKQTNLEKYGVEHNSQNEKIKENKKKKTLKNYGVENPSQNQEIKKKKYKTTFENYGVENPNQNEQIKEKIKHTNLEKYGVTCSLHNKEIKEKIKQTNLERYGVENPTQNPIIAEKIFKSRFKRKPFDFPSGKIVKVQGYEHFCLRDLIEQKIEEEDIVTDIKQVPEVWWEDEEKKKHRYYTDIYIKSQNKCIEVKSKYTFEKEKEEVLCKQQAVKNIGIHCEVWIYNRKGKLIEKLS